MKEENLLESLSRIRIPDDRRDGILRHILDSRSHIQRKNRYRAAGAVLLTAAVSLAMALWAGAGAVPRPDTGQAVTKDAESVSSLPSDSSPQATADPADVPIIYAHTEDQSMNEDLPQKGAIRFTRTLQEQLKDPRNREALFAVKLNPYGLEQAYARETAAFTYQGRTVAQWEAEVSALTRAYNQLLDRKMKQTNGDFDKNELSQDRLACEAAQDRQRDAYEARRAYLLALETQRLQTLGVTVGTDAQARCFYGLLTKTQLEDFPCGQLAYEAWLAQEEACFDE